MRLATIDVGTNTALLLIADVESGAPLAPIHQEQRFVRLGKGVDAHRRINAEAMQRLKKALLEYREIGRAHGAERFILGGTSAVRDAHNRDELIDFVREETGLNLEVLSGEQEAEWSFMGTVSGFSELEGRCMVLDIGGGSTELIVGSLDGETAHIEYRCSLDIGTVRLTERFVREQPAAPADIEEARKYIKHMVAALEVPEGNPPLIGAAGTASSLGMVHTGARNWDELNGRQVMLSREEVMGWEKRLLAMRFEEVLALNQEVLSGRADVFPMGLVILRTVMDHLGVGGLRISGRGLRHGLALRAVADR